MDISGGIWIVLFFLASGVVSVFIGYRGEKAREKRIEYFKSIPGITEEDQR
jgi:hypothetical protein